MGIWKKLLVVILAIGVSYLIRFYSEKNAPTEAFLSRKTFASTSASVRMLQAVALQWVGRNPVANFVESSLHGQLILITGGNTGIGLETVKGLIKRGADVIMVGRSEERIVLAIDRIKSELASENATNIGSVRHIVADMSNLEDVVKLVRITQYHFSTQKIDQLILNAAIWPSEYAVSTQEHEIAFATNTLGPHLLLRGLLQQGVMKADARVISLGGDIYITVAGTADEACTPEYTYATPAGEAGQTAYCRSKLGMMWLFDQMHALAPALRMYLVHPGVIASDLVGDLPIPTSLVLTNQQGAQTTLICATADASQLENGAYYHNTLGKLILPATDPAKNADKRVAFFALAEEMIQPYLSELAGLSQN